MSALSRRGKLISGRDVVRESYDSIDATDREYSDEFSSRRKSYHSGVHRGTDGEIIGDSRLTTEALNNPEGGLPQRRTGIQQSFADRNKSRRPDALRPAMSAMRDQNKKPSPPTGEADAGDQNKATGPVIPPGMIATKIPAAGPVRPGIDKEPMQPGLRPRKGLIDGAPARSAIESARRSAEQSPQAAGRQKAMSSISALGLNGAIRENLSRAQPLDVPMPVKGLDRINTSANAVPPPKASSPKINQTASLPIQPAKKALAPVGMSEQKLPVAPSFGTAKSATPLPTMGLGKGAMNSPMQKLAAAPMGSPAFGSAVKNLATTAAKKIASVPPALGSAIGNSWDKRKRIY